MSTIKRYILFVTIVLGTISFIHKDLNEYGKWLKFHGLKESYFKQTGPEQPEPFDWAFSDRTVIPHALYYSPDSVYFIDLFPVNHDRDSNLNVKLHYNTVQIIRSNDSVASTLFSPISGNGYTETALWRGYALFEIFGFRIRNGRFIPTIWKYDLDKKTCRVFESTKTFRKRQKPYPQK